MATKEMHFYTQMLTALFATHDGDKDGKLSLCELGAIVRKFDMGVDRWDFLKMCDEDGDRKMSLEEFKGYFIETQTRITPAAKQMHFYTQMLTALFATHDQDKDGKLSIFELGDIVKEFDMGVDTFDFLKMCDEDKDRKMSLEEFKKYFIEIYTKDNPAKEMHFYTQMLTAVFASHDKNKDGKLCLRELGALMQEFDIGVDRWDFLQMCDKDGDMKMSLEEFKNYFLETYTTNTASSTEMYFYTQMLAALFATHDQDKDGKLSIFELGDLVRKFDMGVDTFDFLKMCDEDGDRKMSLEEFKGYFIEKKKGEVK